MLVGLERTKDLRHAASLEGRVEEDDGGMSDIEFCFLLLPDKEFDVILVRSLVVGISDHLSNLVVSQALRRDAINLQDDVTDMQVPGFKSCTISLCVRVDVCVQHVRKKEQERSMK